jgi:hypothetical protein
LPSDEMLGTFAMLAMFYLLPTPYGRR